MHFIFVHFIFRHCKKKSADSMFPSADWVTFSSCHHPPCLLLKIKILKQFKKCKRKTEKCISLRFYRNHILWWWIIERVWVWGSMASDWFCIYNSSETFQLPKSECFQLSFLKYMSNLHHLLLCEIRKRYSFTGQGEKKTRIHFTSGFCSSSTLNKHLEAQKSDR